MKYSELIAKTTDITGFSKSQVKLVLESVFSEVQKFIVDGEKDDLIQTPFFKIKKKVISPKEGLNDKEAVPEKIKGIIVLKNKKDKNDQKEI